MKMMALKRDNIQCIKEKSRKCRKDLEKSRIGREFRRNVVKTRLQGDKGPDGTG